MSEQLFLHKLSSPGWTKRFSNKAELAEELAEQICANCMCEVFGAVTDPITQTDLFIKEMLSTCCGTELEFENRSVAKMKFRPTEKTKKTVRRGNGYNSNFAQREKYYAEGLPYNQRVLGNIFSRLHYLAYHAPGPMQKQWRKRYEVFMNKHLCHAGEASVRYVNTYSCHSWM